MHGRRKYFFQGRGSRGFPKFFSGGAKSGEIWFLLLEIEKTTFFANSFKFQRRAKKHESRVSYFSDW